MQACPGRWWTVADGHVGKGPRRMRRGAVVWNGGVRSEPGGWAGVGGMVGRGESSRGEQRRVLSVDAATTTGTDRLATGEVGEQGAGREQAGSGAWQ